MYINFVVKKWYSRLTAPSNPCKTVQVSAELFEISG